MGIIETRIKEAFNKFKQDGNLCDLAETIAHVADYSVQSARNATIMYEAIRTYCPITTFECVYYDGEHSEYRLFDFDPNLISKESLLIEVRSRLEHEIGVELDYIDKAMESVYLMNTNTLLKVR